MPLLSMGSGATTASRVRQKARVSWGRMVVGALVVTVVVMASMVRAQVSRGQRPHRPARSSVFLGASRSGPGPWCDAGRVSERNVLGLELEPCGTEPMTGFFRDGSCATGPEDAAATRSARW